MKTKKAIKSSFEERHPKRSFAIYMTGIALISCGQYVLISLQSSINVEDGLGALSLTLHYATTLVVALLSPAYLQFFSNRSGMLWSDMSALIYCLSNFTSKPFILLPGNIIYGLGKALYWVCSGTYIVLYAKLFEKAGLGTFEDNLSKFSGFMFAAMTSTQVVGNLATTFIFQQNFESENCLNCTEFISSSTVAQETTSQPKYLISEICGAKDCQNPNATGGNRSNYIPPSPISIYIVVGLFSGIALIAVLLHFVFIPQGLNISSNDETTKNISKHGKENKESNKSITINIHDASQDVSGWKRNLQACYSARDEIVATLRHFILPDQLLLTTLQFYTGFNKTFQNNDITRAYISCVYNVSEVGICLAINNAAFFLSSYLSGKVSRRYGRFLPLFFASCGNLVIYAFCLLWVPTETSELWIVYLLNIAYGVCDGVWFSTTISCVAIFFPTKSSRAYTCWITFITIASLLGYGWSTIICVNVKIYVLIAVMAVGVALHFAAEIRLKRRNKESEQEIKMTAL